MEAITLLVWPKTHISIEIKLPTIPTAPSDIVAFSGILPTIIVSILTVGLLVGTNGINVAHELCHRSKNYEKFLGKFLLIPSLYMHFYLEHIFGHHLNVATKEDPVTAKYNQPLYSFWISAIKGEILSAIEIQKKRLDKIIFLFSLFIMICSGTQLYNFYIS